MKDPWSCLVKIGVGNGVDFFGITGCYLNCRWVQRFQNGCLSVLTKCKAELFLREAVTWILGGRLPWSPFFVVLEWFLNK